MLAFFNELKARGASLRVLNLGGGDVEIKLLLASVVLENVPPSRLHRFSGSRQGEPSKESV